MSFNKNASKRLSIIAGIDRESREVNELVNTIANKYITTLLKRLINVVLFSGRKTIIVEDLRFLHQICPDQPQIACAENLTKLVKVCIDSHELEQVLRMQKGYVVYTRRKPFENLIRDTIRQLYKEEIRIGKNVVSLLQNLTEHYIINIMTNAARYLAREGRDTLLPRDIETAALTLL